VVIIVALRHFDWLTDVQTTGLIAPLVTLLGVMLTLNWSQRQHESNLREEREKTAEARRLSAKQAAFLEAIEAVIGFLNHLGALPDRDLPKNGETAKEIPALSLALTKLHFFSELPTIECCIRLNRFLLESYLVTIQAKLPGSFTSGDIETAEGRITQLEQQARECVEQMGTFIKIDPHHEVLPHLQKALAEARDELAKLYGRKTTLITLKYQQNQECRAILNARLKLLYPQTIELYLAAREELGFPIDADRYRSQMMTETEALLKQTDAMFTHIREEAEKRMKG
jgi:hypothetical protein